MIAWRRVVSWRSTALVAIGLLVVIVGWLSLARWVLAPLANGQAAATYLSACIDAGLCPTVRAIAAAHAAKQKTEVRP